MPEFSVKIAWVGVEESPILFANAFMSQFIQDEFILSIGQLTPPVLTGSDEQKSEQIKGLGLVPIKAVARIGMTAGRLKELIGILQQNLDSYDEMTKQ